jgi:hypothetical protein
MSGDPRCPVCDRPVGPAAPEATCAQCGWLLHLPLHAGPVTTDMRRDFEARLQGARRNQAERDGQTLCAALNDIIRDLRPGTTSAVIDVSADGVEVTTAYLDGTGSPQVRESGDVTWTSVLRMLPAAEQARYSPLADGIDGFGNDSIASLLGDRIPPAGNEQVLAICRPVGWRVIEAAAMALAARPGARVLRLSGRSDLSVRKELADLAAKAPLRHSYRLMTVTVDGQTGAVALRPRQLFAVGDGPGAEAGLTLRRMPGDVADTTLAIFADAGNSPAAPGAADPLALYSVPMPPGPAARLRAVLDGPGRVRIVEPRGAVPHPGTWAQVRGQIPSQVTTTAAPVDLVCAIDLAGTRDTVGRRVGLVRDLVRLLEAEFPGQQRLRVGMVTCTDHVFASDRRGAEYDPVTRAAELGPVADALAWLDQATGADMEYPLCAPVEDLLDESLRMLADSRRARRVPRLLTVAGRRPHPYPQPIDRRLPCPFKLVWQHIMDQLAREAGVRCAVVADALPGGAERAEWRRLGPAGQRVLSKATAREVAEDLGLLTHPDQRIPLPLTDKPEGANR